MKQPLLFAYYDYEQGHTWPIGDASWFQLCDDVYSYALTSFGKDVF